MSARPRSEMDQVAFAIWKADIERARKRGEPVSPLVREAAEHIGICERTAWRWLEGEPAGRPKRAWDQRHNKYVRLHDGNLAAAHLLARSDAEAPFPLSLSSFRRAFAGLAPAVQAGLLGGLGKLKTKQHRLKLEVTHRNERWEADHTVAPIWVRHPETGRLCRPWMTLVVDCYSGIIVGFAFTVAENGSADTSSILAALGAAIRRYGRPEELVYDQGADFVGGVLTRALLRLRIQACPVAAGTPEAKPFVESANRKVKAGYFPPKPGYFIPRKSAA